MSDAIEKTQSIKRMMLSVESLVPNALNPNEMSEAEFNMLASNIDATGITDPILVRDLGEGKYRIIGGHNRFEVAKLYGFTEVPCTIIDDPEFDEDQEKFQVVRMNTIRGHLSPEKFMAMYQSLSGKYQDSIMAESFGFADEDEFRKLIAQVKKSLPKELQADFVKAAEELKTIDDLSKLLNSLFTRYGNTLPFGFLCMDFGGKDSIWLRMESSTRKAILEIGKVCVDNRRTVDDIIGGLLKMAAKGTFSKELMQLIADSTEVDIPEGTALPTAELLAGNPNMM